MRFGFDDDQLAFAEAVRALLDKECPPDTVRAAWEAPPGGLDRAPWTALTEMGVLGVLAPEADGGLGLDERSLVLLLEESGRAALPHPLVDTAAATAPLAAGVVARGVMIATDLGGALVPCAADADALLLRAGDALHLVDPAAVELTPADTVDRSRRAARIRWSGAGGTVVTDDPSAVAAAFDRGVLGVSAQLVGLGQRMLDLTVRYVAEREQFGVPVGSFQAVKHHLADAAKDLAFARPAVHRAAWSLAVGSPDAPRDVSMAKVMASDAAAGCGRMALQCHGAIGYTTEHDLHFYLKRAWALVRSWGDAAWHRQRVATEIGVS